MTYFLCQCGKSRYAYTAGEFPYVPGDEYHVCKNLYGLRLSLWVKVRAFLTGLLNEKSS